MLEQRDLRRVLVVQTAFLGDIVLTMPLIRILRAAGSEHIVIATSPAGHEAMTAMKEVDEVIVLDKRATHRSMRATWQAGAALRNHDFASALVPHRSMRSAVFARAASPRVRVGFQNSAGRLLFSHTVPYHPALPETHRDVDLLAPFHLPAAITSLPRFTVPTRSHASTPVHILVAPGSQWGTKQWPLPRFAEVVRECVSRGWQVTITGSAAEAALCDQLAGLAGSSTVRVASGSTWLQFREFVERADVLVANDTAAVHVANDVGTPVVALFGPTVPEFGFAPRGAYDRVLQVDGLVCRPCDAHGAHRCPLSTHACMREISASSVIDAIHDVMRTVYAAT